MNEGKFKFDASKSEAWKWDNEHPEILIVRDQAMHENASLYRDEPDAFIWDILNVRNFFTKALEFIYAVRDNKRTACRGSFGSSKTFWSACIVLWFICTRFNSRVITTAPRERQVRDLLWAEINSLYNRSRIKLGGKITSDRLSFGPKWFGVGITGNQKNETAMQGLHGETVLVLGDEATGLSANIFDIADRLAVGPDDKEVWIGNPTDPMAAFATLFKNPNFAKVVISAYDTPNVIARSQVIPGMVSWEWVEEKRKRWGENSQLFKSKVLAEFPDSGEDSLIPLSWIEKAMARWEDLIDETRKEQELKSQGEAIEYLKKIFDKPKRLGIDVGGQGTDPSVFFRRVKNFCDNPEKVFFIDTQEIAAKAQLEHKRGYDISVDAIGIGAGVADTLRANGVIVNKFIGSERSEKRDKTDSFGFVNRRTEGYWTAREALDPTSAEPMYLPRSEQLLEELAIPTWKLVTGGKVKITTKEEVKAKLGRSPDEADAFVMSLDEGETIGFALPAITKPKEEKQPIKIQPPTGRKW